ncbi:HlyD family secretion protein [Methylobacterium gnaphalii]|uniref:Hemolysin secretion protein D n=1 Tax=Methylobacterium gnaphalii TaxID=1010610 RepID=A0A512JJ59_9HYPH|nr:HlyD family secretion protein [Methylobacterium gnaphalii]GEP09974.1 hemolysin secretion protein D [Methylobacterium gnaphalii]GJD68251.1 Colistin resistance protein EmrA [Methylobacterium gnaphalii]GLS51662.1 hemolysin secretion protein D [Methylobacterium gnaphalii]
MLDDQSKTPPDGEQPRNERAERPADPDRQPSSDTPSKSGKDSSSDEASEDKRGVIRRHPVLVLAGFVMLVALVVGGYVYWLGFIHPYETTDDAFVDARQFTIAPKVGGYVIDVPVTDNQHVEAGAVLAQIDTRDYRIALEQAEAQIQAAEATIQNIDAQVEAQRAQIEVARAQVDTAQAALKFAQEDADRYRELAQKGAGTVQRSQQSSSDLQQRQASLSSANASVVAAQKQIGSLQAQRASAESSLAQAKAQRDQAGLNLGYTTVTAAQAGRIVQLTAAKGQFAQAGQSLSMFVPDEKWVIANYKETQITDMRPGQAVAIEIDAYPGRGITGRIDSVQPGSGTAFSLLPAQNATGNYVKVTQRIPVKILVDNWPTDVAIGPGMSVVPRAHVR